MSRPAQIRFLACFAGAYDPPVRLLRCSPLRRAVSVNTGSGHGA